MCACTLVCDIITSDVNVNDWCVMCHTVTAATNKQRSAAKDTAKLDRETEELHRTLDTYYVLCH